MNKRIIYLGLSGFPKGLAAIQRQLLISKSLVEQGWDVLVLNSKPVHSLDSTVQDSGIFEGVRYHYLHGSKRPSSFWKRNILKLYRPIEEFCFIKKESKNQRIDAAIISNRNLILENIWYFFLSRLFNFKLIINLVEDYSDRDNRTLLRKVNDALFNKYGLIFCDGFLPISDYIIKKNKGFNKPFLYTPVIVDSSKFIVNFKYQYKKSFVYCGSVSYIDSINFIIDSFELISNSDVELILILNGEKSNFDRISDKIKQSSKSRLIKILTQLPYNELVRIYSTALALILPLFDTVQDKARFPHKLGEYLASQNPVVTANIGEVGRFIEDKKNGIFYDVNNKEDLSSKLEWVISHQELSAEIGMRGYFTMLNNFDYKQLGFRIDRFILNLK